MQALTEADKKDLKRLMEQMQEDLRQQVEQGAEHSAPVELDQNRQGRLSRMDALQGQAMLQAGLERQRRQLVAIQNTIAQLDTKDFGRCEECDQWILIARLKLDPTAKHCVACASLFE